MQSPADYAGAMDLPNGKALSVEDLKKFLKHHHDGFAKKARARARSDLRCSLLTRGRMHARR